MSKQDPNQFLPILKLNSHDLTSYAMVVGPSSRVRKAAELMHDVREIGFNREYLTVTGIYKDTQITIASHGVGAASANNVFFELLRGGVHTIIRAGTCGALEREIDDGDFIILTGAVREDLATESLMPIAYPAVADREVLNALIVAAKDRGYKKPHIGLGITSANFYSTPVVPNEAEKYMGYGVKSRDMEAAPLMVIASMNGARAGVILTSDGNAVREKEEQEKHKGKPEDHVYDPYREVVDQGIETMLEVTLDALNILATADKQD